MPMPEVHYALGMTCGGIASVAVPWFRRRWYKIGPLFMTFCGVWAMLPDVPRVLGQIPGWVPFYGLLHGVLGSRSAHKFMHGGIGNIFFGHALLDNRFLDDYYLAGYAAVLGIYTVILIVYAIRWPRRTSAAPADEAKRTQREAQPVAREATAEDGSG